MSPSQHIAWLLNRVDEPMIEAQRRSCSNRWLPMVRQARLTCSRRMFVSSAAFPEVGQLFKRSSVRLSCGVDVLSLAVDSRYSRRPFTHTVFVALGVTRADPGPAVIH